METYNSIIVNLKNRKGDFVMGKKKEFSSIEVRIAFDKRKRREQIIERISLVVFAIIVIWFLLSWGEIVWHNMAYYKDGTITSYSKLNIINIIINLLSRR